jgi:hypothetical protein
VKQEEVYDFAKSLKETATEPAAKGKGRKGSALNIIGPGRSGVDDVAHNHDKCLYDE